MFNAQEKRNKWEEYNFNTWQYNLQKKRFALCLGFGALGGVGVSACLLLQLYAGLAVMTAVTALMPPAALVTLPIAAAVIVGGLAFLAIRALRAYKSHADVQYESDNLIAHNNFVQNRPLGVGGYQDLPITKPLHRLANNLYGKKSLEGRPAFSFWGRLFSRAPVAPPLMDPLHN